MMKPIATAALAALMTIAAPLAARAAEMLQEGQAMPSFELVDHEGRTVRSSDLAGKRYLLWFYPKAMTQGCTIEAQGLRDNHAELEKAGVVVLGVSFDAPAENKRFVEAESLPFRLLSDQDRKLALAVGAADAADARTARRISYLVGADGKVVKAYASVEPGTHAAQVLADCGGGTT